MPTSNPVLRTLTPFAPAAAWAIALAIVAWVGAGWFWEWASPRNAPVVLESPTDPVATAQLVAERHLMGSTSETLPGGQVANPGNLQLWGVMTASQGRPGFAIVTEDGKAPVAVIEGEDLAPGVTLSRVGPEDAVFSRKGGSETVQLPVRPSNAAASPGAAPGETPPAADHAGAGTARRTPSAAPPQPQPRQ